MAGRLSMVSAASFENSRFSGGKKVAILDRTLSKGHAEVSLSAFAFMFSEMLQYSQKRVNGIQDLERKLADFGYRVGIRAIELVTWRDKGGKRETRMINMLYFVHSVLWKSLFGKQADSLEKSTDNEDEYMISDNDPVVTRYISVPREYSSLNCGAFMAGIVEAVLDGSQFPARVSAHSNPMEGYPGRTTLVIKFDRSVMEREKDAEPRR
ncbi:TRAPP subunit trs31 [Gonapodya sp. JEL0774]|nr:TRAPP subunit trs31 [Gonapodya sp. JEL0774]